VTILPGGRSDGGQQRDKHFAGCQYFDLAGSYNLSKSRDFAARDQPICSTRIRRWLELMPGRPFGNGNTYPVVYDALGRRFSST